MLSMKCSFYSAFKASMLLIMIIFDFSLVGISTYFKSKSIDSLSVGLSGVSLQGQHYSFQDFAEICIEELLTSQICNNTGNLSQAGTIFQAFIAIDIVILSICAICSLAQSFFVKKIIQQNVKLEELPKLQRGLLYVAYHCRIILVVHPVIINLGFGLWIGVSKIEDFSGDVQIKEGVIVAICQSFFSLLAIASYCWESSAMKRRNVRETIKRREKNKKYMENKRENSLKANSFDQTFDDKSMVLAGRV